MLGGSGIRVNSQKDAVWLQARNEDPDSAFLVGDRDPEVRFTMVLGEKTPGGGGGNTRGQMNLYNGPDIATADAIRITLNKDTNQLAFEAGVRDGDKVALQDFGQKTMPDSSRLRIRFENGGSSEKDVVVISDGDGQELVRMALEYDFLSAGRQLSVGFAVGQAIEFLEITDFQIGTTGG